MIKNFQQQYEVDYFKIYIIVIKLILYKIILILTAYYSLVIHQINIKSVFLNTELNKEIYMKLPDKFKEEEDLVCYLLKSLYKLK